MITFPEVGPKTNKRKEGRLEVAGIADGRFDQAVAAAGQLVE